MLHPGSLAPWSETPSEDHPFRLLLGLREVMSAAEAEFTPRAPRHLIASLFPSLPTAWGLEHHRALGQGQLPGDPAGGHFPLPHLALLLCLRQRRFQELQQQRDPGKGSGIPGRRGRTSWPVWSLASAALGQVGRGLALAGRQASGVSLSYCWGLPGCLLE